MINYIKHNSIPFLNELSDSALSELEHNAKSNHFKKSETIVYKGQKIGGAYVVQSGTLRIFTMDSNGNEKPIYSLNTGEICIFSINCIFKQVVYPAWVTIDSESADVLAIPTLTF